LKDINLTDDKKILHVISNETKNSIDQMAVVTPSVYASIFSQYATEHGKEIEHEPTLAYDIMKTECTTLSTLQSQTSKNASQLSQSTHKAISAIKEKDEALLTEVLKETQSLKEEIEKLKAAVYKDELTHVYNRKWLHDTLLNENENNFLNSGILIMIDLNYFKQINDTHGHILGDKVLIFVANELKKSRQSIIRYGGDEFIIIFDSYHTLQNALDELNKIREYVLKKKLKAHKTVFRVSFSIGGVAFKEGDSLSQTIENADKNMYEDKQQIKKRITSIEL
jgi:diguanylate cyclase (GGDEF)-like protein